MLFSFSIFVSFPWLPSERCFIYLQSWIQYLFFSRGSFLRFTSTCFPIATWNFTFFDNFPALRLSNVTFSCYISSSLSSFPRYVMVCVAVRFPGFPLFSYLFSIFSWRYTATLTSFPISSPSSFRVVHSFPFYDSQAFPPFLFSLHSLSPCFRYVFSVSLAYVDRF